MDPRPDLAATSHLIGRIRTVVAYNASVLHDELQFAPERCLDHDGWRLRAEDDGYVASGLPRLTRRSVLLEPTPAMPGRAGPGHAGPCWLPWARVRAHAFHVSWLLLYGPSQMS